MGLKDNVEEVSQETRYEALLQVSAVLASQADLKEVLENLARFLPSVVSFEFLGVVLHDAKRRVFRLHAFEGTLEPILRMTLYKLVAYPVSALGMGSIVTTVKGTKTNAMPAPWLIWCKRMSQVPDCRLMWE